MWPFCVYLSHYECMAGVDISSLAASMFPWDSIFLEQQEALVQWVFILITGTNFVLILRYWGSRSSFRKDPHKDRALKVFCGLRTVCRLEKRMQLESRCFENWVVSCMGCEIEDTVGRQKFSSFHKHWKRRTACIFAYWALHLPITLFMALPGLGYILA